MMDTHEKSSLRKRHILMINVPDFWAPDTVGGQETQILLLTRELIRKGNKVTIVLPKEVSLCGHLRGVGARVEIVPLRSRFSFACIPRLIRLARKEEIHLVHTHECRGNLFGLITAKIARTKMVVTRHEIYLSPWLRGRRRLKKRVYMLMDKILFQWVDGIITVSEKVREKVVSEQGVRPDKVTTVHVGVDVKRFTRIEKDTELQKELGIEGEYLVVGSVGRLVPEKGYGYLIEAARIVTSAVRRTKFIIVGNGPEMERLTALTKRMGLSERVLFVGKKNDVPRWISLMNIFVLPSLTEGLPVVLLEAMAMKKPVVATDVGGVPEVVTHMQNGILVSPANPQELANALVNLLRSKAIRDNLAREGQKTVGDRFKLGMMVEKTERLYEGVLRE